jgi:cyanophycin synthetase
MPTDTGDDWPPFDLSRRLTGANLFFGVAGATMEVPHALAFDAAHEAGWRARVLAACAALGWPEPQLAVRRHAAGTSLALTAPIDQLLTATSVNEWAWLDCLSLPWLPDAWQPPDEDADGDTAADAPPLREPIFADRAAALAALAEASQAERRPALIALIDEAQRRRLPVLWDDTAFTIGSGRGGRTWPLDALPAIEALPWPACHAVPTALVTGTNGKTTTVRLLAAIAREAGLHSGHSCTDGLYLDGERIAPGDYAGPAGTREVLRHTGVDAAILETARGGILRRGLGVNRADAAIVTNISDDHFGEWGIDDIDALAQVKLVVAHAIGSDGLLALNADDATLAAASNTLACPIGWFAHDDAHPRLAAHRAAGGPTCGVDRAGRIRLVNPSHGIDADLGEGAAMPLAAGGRAAYNVANLLGAALVASALGWPPTAIRAVFHRFGNDRRDNPGRLQRWLLGSGENTVEVFIDYAHNPQGLAGLLRVAWGEPSPSPGDSTAPPRSGRLGLVLGQAGNRDDAEIGELAATAARFRPSFVVLKEIEGMLRGREPGEVPQVLRAALRRAGVADTAIDGPYPEADAARRALTWARGGDVLVLPTHAVAAVVEVQALLDRLEREGRSPAGR